MRGVDAQGVECRPSGHGITARPRELPPIAPAAAAQLEAMMKLHEEMQKLHAQVEYVALMLKLGLHKATALASLAVRAGVR